MEIRMSEEEYYSAAEDAKKVLETLDPEAINWLKNKCVSEIRDLTTLLENH